MQEVLAVLHPYNFIFAKELRYVCGLTELMYSDVFANYKTGNGYLCLSAGFNTWMATNCEILTVRELELIPENNLEES